MFRFFSHPKFLGLYSGVLTLALGFILLAGFAGRSGKAATFDQITVQRINLVEPDGTLRLILSDRAEFPGSMYHGKEIARPDRNDSAGMIFMNDEGTEDGGLIFGGLRDKAGKVHSFGHLSFDQYDQDQTLTLDAFDEGDQHGSQLELDQRGNYYLTPEVFAETQKIKAMPQGPARAAAWKAYFAKYRGDANRATLSRDPDNSVALRLRDPQGKKRLVLEVNGNGTPVLQFLDADGKVLKEIGAK